MKQKVIKTLRSAEMIANNARKAILTEIDCHRNRKSGELDYRVKLNTETPTTVEVTVEDRYDMGFLTSVIIEECIKATKKYCNGYSTIYWSIDVKPFMYEQRDSNGKIQWGHKPVFKLTIYVNDCDNK